MTSPASAASTRAPIPVPNSAPVPTAVITGASSGIGAACAAVFAGAGHDLLLFARRAGRLDAVAEGVRRAHPERTVFVHILDVRDRAAVDEVCGALDERWRAPDVLINNAGLSRGLDKVYDGDVEDWEEMIDTNIKGLLYVTRALLPHMVARGRGTVLNIASIAGREVYVGGNVYSATKSAVRALSRSMQLDLLGTGVRVTNVDPGLVETEFSLVRFHGDGERAVKVYQDYTPLEARDVAEVALFCAERPPHVSIHDILVMPADQAAVGMVNRRRV